MSKIHIGSDHAGREVKAALTRHLRDSGFTVIDDYTPDTAQSIDYPDIAHHIAAVVSATEGELGILICGTGIGMSIAANRIRGARAALCTTELHAKLARQHNHANILCLGARVLGIEAIFAIADTFLHTPVDDDERHYRRVRKIEPGIVGD